MSEGSTHRTVGSTGGGSATSQHTPVVLQQPSSRGHSSPERSSGVTSGSRISTREMKDASHDMGEQVVKTAEKIYHQACDACHNWRHYPKLLTTMVLLLSFLLGAGSMGLVSKTGLMGRGGNYISSHWDRNTADAHHALDVILDHLKHPELYEESVHGEKMVHKARGTIGDFMKGILPSSWGGRKSARDYADDAGEYVRGGSSMKSMGRGRGIGTQMYDQVSDTVGDIAHGVRRGAEQGVGMVKDSSYGIGSKLGDIADSVKNKFSMGGDHYDDYISSGKGRGVRGGSTLGGLFGGSRYDEEDDINAATQKLKRVVRQADREL